MEKVRPNGSDSIQILLRDCSTPEKVSYQRWHVSFRGYAPAKEFSNPGHWAQYHLTKDALQRILSNWDEVASWRLSKQNITAGSGGYHPAALLRTRPPTPIRLYLDQTPRTGKPLRILYHGVGRDVPGTVALSQGGINTVSIYDPFHPDKNVRQLPSGPFDVIHSHYTLNVVDRLMGRQIIQDIHDRLAIGGEAIISVREDV